MTTATTRDGLTEAVHARIVARVERLLADAPPIPPAAREVVAELVQEITER